MDVLVTARSDAERPQQEEAAAVEQPDEPAEHGDRPSRRREREQRGALWKLQREGLREELAEHEDALKALILAHRAIAAACVGVNGDLDLGLNLSVGAQDFTYFTAPAGHTFIFRLFNDRKEAVQFMKKRTGGDKKSVEWAETLPLASAKELQSYH